MKHKINFSSYFAFCILNFALCIALTGCAHKPKQILHTGKVGGTLRIAVAGGELRSLDPARIGDTASSLVGQQIYNGLVDFDDELQIVPSLADSWVVSDAGKTWTFHLRKDVVFHDDACFPGGKGRGVSADDLKYSLQRICDPRSLSTGWWIFDGKIEGANMYRDAVAKNITPADVSGFKVIDPYTFQIKLIKPFAPFLNLLTMSYCCVVTHEAIEKYGADFFKHPVGTGPFQLKEWTPGLRVLLTKNPRYFERDAMGKSVPYVDGIRIQFLREATMVFLEFEKGSFDVTGIPPEYWAKVMTKDHLLQAAYAAKYNLKIGHSLDVGYFGFLSGKSPLGTNLKLRQAFNYAIDRQAIVDFVLNGRGVPARGVLPPGIPGYNPDLKGYNYDPAKAKLLLAEAGYPDGKGLKEFDLQLNSGGAVNEDIAAAVQAQLAKVGIKVKLKLISWPQHLDSIDRGVAEFFRLGWLADYPDPENFLALFYSKNFSPSGPNSTRYSNPKVDALYEKALSETNDSIRFKYYRQAEELIVADAPWLFLTHGQGYRLEQKYVHGYPNNPLGRSFYKYVYLN